MKADLESRRRETFEALAEIVQTNYAAGRRSYGASIKPELMRRLGGEFSEWDLHYQSFAEFLHAAADARAVDVYKAPKGPDWEAVPRGRTPLAAAWVEADRRPPGRVRPDLWTCFVDWREQMLRIYDREADRAYVLPRLPPGHEPAEQASLRRRYHVDRERFVEIPNVSFETHVRWMREFAEQLPQDSAREVLLFALGRDRPAREFTDALAAKPELRQRWQAERLRRVLESIRAWVSEHRITLDILEQRDPASPARERSEPAMSAAPAAQGTAPGLQAASGDVRQALHRAIDRMPESQLLRIAIPVEYLLSD